MRNPTVPLLLRAVRSTGEFVFELFDASCRVDELQFARVERMANATNIDLEFRLGRPGRKLVSATTGYLGLNVLRMNVTFHDYIFTRAHAHCTRMGKNVRGTLGRVGTIGCIKLLCTLGTLHPCSSTGSTG